MEYKITIHNDMSDEEWTRLYDLVFENTNDNLNQYLEIPWPELKQIIIKRVNSLSKLELAVYDIKNNYKEKIK